MGIFDFLFKKSSEPTAPVGGLDRKRVLEVMNDNQNLDVDVQIQLLKTLGYTDKDIASPLIDKKNQFSLLNHFGKANEKDGDEFLDLWATSGFINDADPATESKRKRRYEDYNFMIANNTESNMALRTYIEEVDSAIREDENFFRAEVRNRDGDLLENDTEFANQMLKISGSIDDPRVLASQLCQYGDAFFRIEDVRPVNENDSESYDGYTAEGHFIDYPLKAQRINFPDKDIPYKFIQFKGDPQARGQGEDVLPFDMIHYRISTSRRDLLPYGESLLEASRSVYKRLLIVEALLALSRQSKVDRLIVKVPTGTSNPDVMINKLMRFKNMFKNIIMGNANELETQKKNIGFTEILFAPKGTKPEESFDIDKLSSSIDLASTDDVEYFLDKVINGLNLPRGYLKSDDAYQGYRKLALQDLRLSRTINSVFRAMAEGHALLIKIMMQRCDKWDNNKVVFINYTPPAPIAAEQLDAVSKSLDVVQEILDMSEKAGAPATPERVRELLIKIAKLPNSVVDLILPEDGVPDIAPPTSDEFDGFVDADGGSIDETPGSEIPPEFGGEEPEETTPPEGKESFATSLKKMKSTLLHLYVMKSNETKVSSDAQRVPVDTTLFTESTTDLTGVQLI